MGNEIVDKLKLKYSDVRTMHMTSGTDLYWVKCRVCDGMWVATEDDKTDGICHQHRCQDSFESKVIRALPQEA